jgi:chemotaxis protein CheX
MVQLIDESSRSAVPSPITDTAVLDQAVEDVLGLMLGVPVAVVNQSIEPSAEPLTLTAVIGLAGALSGAFTVLVDSRAAMQMTACLMGMEVSSLDDSVFDGLGEVTNMLAGAWKARIANLSAACLLSVPTVVTGTQYEVHKRTTAFHMTRSYRFDSHIFTVTIYGENP